MNLLRKLFAAALLVLGTSNIAYATNCGSFPYTLQNNTTADANQVMANFNTLLNCSNTNLLGKANNLADVNSISASRTNLGLGSAATANAGDPTHQVVTAGGVLVSGHFPVFVGVLGDSVDSGYVPLNPANNLSDVANSATALTNLGAQASLGFTPLNPANNLSDVASAATSRTNLGLTAMITAAQTPSASASYSQSNTLGAVPIIYSVACYIINTGGTDVGHGVGDIVTVGFGGSSRNDGVSCWFNSSAIGFDIGQNGIFINQKGGSPSGGFAINASKWAIYVVLKYN